ncbi:hypothetical protein ATANTOWER_011379 [Ataeniobius toweri]|uniref:Uncharacterized protein n=1 Tax=Ataeniobius toweri TaxID=208326 RepID=A0ABU7AF01_9TELE|nr:hypothetical protein [Ataeniobius toweri]
MQKVSRPGTQDIPAARSSPMKGTSGVTIMYYKCHTPTKLLLSENISFVGTLNVQYRHQLLRRFVAFKIMEKRCAADTQGFNAKARHDTLQPCLKY